MPIFSEEINLNRLNQTIPGLTGLVSTRLAVMASQESALWPSYIGGTELFVDGGFAQCRNS